MDYIKLPITEKIENKIIFYLNIEEPFRGTSKLRGIQIFNKLRSLGYDCIWIPSLHGHQFNNKLDINIFEHIYNCKIIFIKYPVVDWNTGIKVLNLLKKNKNKLIYDFCDTNIKKNHFIKTLNYYDHIIFMDNKDLLNFSKFIPKFRKKYVCIEHHYDSELDNIKIDNLKTKNPKIYYFGNLYKTLLGDNFKKLNIINLSNWNQEIINDSIAQICLRQNCTISQLKIGNCVKMNSVPIINLGIYDDYFDINYPYILKDIKPDKLKVLCEKIKLDYLNQTSDWIKAQKYVSSLKKLLSQENIIKKYEKILI